MTKAKSERAGGPRGRFITFEGGEGAGKSTQARRLKAFLETKGLGVMLTREPGGSSGAEIIRHVILSGQAKHLGADGEAMLFAAARLDHLTTTILPALETGAWVLCDRFADSTRVYQGLAGRADPILLADLETLVVGPHRPDLTLVLDLPPKVGLARASSRGGEADRFEAEAMAFHTALRKGFRALVDAEPERCVLIDASKEPDAVAAAVREVVEARFALTRERAGA